MNYLLPARFLLSTPNYNFYETEMMITIYTYLLTSTPAHIMIMIQAYHSPAYSVDINRDISPCALLLALPLVLLLVLRNPLSEQLDDGALGASP